MKKCPFCGADIEESARFCLYCMTPLTEKEQILPYQKKKTSWLILIAAIVILFLTLAIIWLCARVISSNTPPADTEKSVDTTESLNKNNHTETPPVTEPQHIHSFSIENTEIEYLQKEATCIDPATYYYSCLCGEKGSETFFYGEVGEHIVETKTGYSADCVNTGLTDGTYCSVCDTVFLSQTVIPVINHTFDNDQDESCNICNYVRILNCNHSETIKLSATMPTCTTMGLSEGKKCAICQQILVAQTILAPSGHTEVIDQAIAPTCTTTGKTEGSHCSICNTVILSPTIIPVINHKFDNDRDESCNVCNYIRVINCNHSETVSLPATTPTCTTGGKTEGKKCTLCGEILIAQTILAPTGHTEVIDQAISPTCTSLGKTEGTHCSVCQVVLIHQQYVSALGHSFNPEKPQSPCSRCGALQPHNHNYTEQNMDTKYLKSTATCVTRATYYYSCACGEKGSEVFYYGQVIPHTLVTIPGYPATCTESGLTDKVYCSFCQDTIEIQWTTNPLGHTFDLSDPSQLCLTCGEKGTLNFQTMEFPIIIRDNVRVNSCTYTHQVLNGINLIDFYLNVTNLSSESMRLHIAGDIYSPTVGSWIGCTFTDSELLAPNESGTCSLHVNCVPNTELEHKLRIY